MRSLTYLGIALLVGASACNLSNPTTTDPEPAAATMSFRTGASYQFQTYHTDATTNARTDSTLSTRTWGLVSRSATVYGRSPVAIYVDSVLSAGSIFTLADSVYLQQQSGTNDIYRYQSLVPELDISGISAIDLGKQWMHEGKLNAASALWLSAESADTLPNTYGIPAVSGIKVSISDSAVASTAENLTIDGQTYATTKTTHNMVLQVAGLLNPVLGITPPPIVLGSKTIDRTVWIAPSLGTIVREERAGAVLDASYQGNSLFSIPVPGYYSTMVKVLALGQ